MKTLAIIPARGGSKGIPNKNIKMLGGKNLIEYTIDSAKNCKDIDKIFVSTDDVNIEKYRNNIVAIGHPTKDPNRGRMFLNATKGAEIATGLPPIVPEADEISATRLRNAITNKDKEAIKQSLPDDSMYEQFMNIIFSS